MEFFALSNDYAQEQFEVLSRQTRELAGILPGAGPWCVVRTGGLSHAHRERTHGWRATPIAAIAAILARSPPSHRCTFVTATLILSI